jgi:hypothetical protein
MNFLGEHTAEGTGDRTQEKISRVLRERFEEMSPEDRKVQVRRCVSRIVVDKERGIATAYIRRIPAALPVIEELYKKQRPPTTGVVSGRSSGDRT